MVELLIMAGLYWACFLIVMPVLFVPTYQEPNQDLLTINLKLASFMTALVGIPFLRLPTKLLAWRPRKVIELEVRRIDLHRLLHWIWVRADEQETWLQVDARRTRLASAIGRSGESLKPAIPSGGF